MSVIKMNIYIYIKRNVCLSVWDSKLLPNYWGGGGGRGGVSRNYKELTRALLCKFSRKFSVD